MLDYEDFFGVFDRLRWYDMAKVRMHFGHHKTVREPLMHDYLYGTRFGIDIIDLDKVNFLRL